MSEQKWTKEPWEVNEGGNNYTAGIDGPGGEAVLWCTSEFDEGVQKKDDVLRMVVCVNACKGAPESIQPGAVKAMHGKLNEAMVYLRSDVVQKADCCAHASILADDIESILEELYHGKVS